MRVLPRFLAALALSTIALTALLFVGAVMVVRTAAIERSYRSASTDAAHLAGDLNERLDTFRRLAKQVSSSSIMKQAVLDGNDAFLSARLRTLRDFHPTLANAILTDEKGIVTHSVRRSMVGRPGFGHAEVPWNLSEPIVETSVKDAPDGYPVVSVFAAIRDERLSIVAFLGLELNTMALGRDVMKTDGSIVINIADADGTIIAYSHQNQSFVTMPDIPDHATRRFRSYEFPSGFSAQYIAVGEELGTIPWTLAYFVPADGIRTQVWDFATKLGAMLVIFVTAFLSSGLLVLRVFFKRPVNELLSHSLRGTRGEEMVPGALPNRDGGIVSRLRQTLDWIRAEYDDSKSQLEALRQEREAVFSAIPAIAVLIQPDRSHRFLTAPPEDLGPLATALEDMLALDGRRSGSDPIWTVVAEIESGETGHICRRGPIPLRDGTEQNVLVCGSVASGADGDRILLTVFDLMLLEGAESSEASFLAVVSHELRTPLNGISGLAQLIKEDGLATGQNDHMSRLEGAISTMDQLIADIQDYSRLARGRSSLDIGPIVLEDVADYLKTAHAERIREKGLELQVEVDGERIASGDKLRLLQILGNLIDNAVKYTDSGSVNVVLQNRDELLIIVSDTGIGLPEDDRERIFRAFTQLSDPHSRRSRRGLGLGLAMVQKLVALWGGSITVTSEVNVGSTFAVRLPPLETSSLEVVN